MKKSEMPGPTSFLFFSGALQQIAAVVAPPQALKKGEIKWEDY